MLVLTIHKIASAVCHSHFLVLGSGDSVHAPKFWTKFAAGPCHSNGLGDVPAWAVCTPVSRRTGNAFMVSSLLVVPRESDISCFADFFSTAGIRETVETLPCLCRTVLPRAQFATSLHPTQKDWRWETREDRALHQEEGRPLVRQAPLKASPELGWMGCAACRVQSC